MLCSVTFSENSTVYDKMRKNIAEWGRPHFTIWLMRIARWIPKATNTHTHSQCVILIAFPLQQWLHERASVLPYTYIACLVHCYASSCSFHSLNYFSRGETGFVIILSYTFMVGLIVSFICLDYGLLLFF